MLVRQRRHGAVTSENERDMILRAEAKMQRTMHDLVKVTQNRRLIECAHLASSFPGNGA